MLKAILYVLALIAAVALAIVAGTFILAAVGLFLAIFVVVWLAGVPITIKQGNREIGYVRWLTFYPHDHGGLAGPRSITRR